MAPVFACPTPLVHERNHPSPWLYGNHTLPPNPCLQEWACDTGLDNQDTSIPYAHWFVQGMDM